MSEATTNTSLGVNPFAYYGEKSNSELENAKNHFIESWVPATLIATVAAAVATPLAILAGMKWGVLAAMGFIATPASVIAISILAAAIVTVITLVAVLAIQSCYRCQNSTVLRRDADGRCQNSTVLRRDADGLYTLPHVDVPGFRNMGTTRAKELKIHFGDFHIDTANGIVPSGWVLER